MNNNIFLKKLITLKASIEVADLTFSDIVIADLHKQICEIIDDFENKTIAKWVCLKQCSETLPSGGRDNICLNCGSSIEKIK